MESIQTSYQNRTPCAVADCNNLAKAKGLCGACYSRERRRREVVLRPPKERAATPSPPPRSPPSRAKWQRADLRQCSVDACLGMEYRRTGACEEHFRDQQAVRRAARNAMPSGRPRRRARRGEAKAFYLDNVAEPSIGCKIWPYGTGNGGYGTICIDGKRKGVHVLACEVFHGPMPHPGMEAAHSCKNRRCWAGEHLSWKDHVDNEADKLRDKTLARGERHGMARLTAKDVRKIRKQWATGHFRQPELAAQYDVTQQTISFVVRGLTWKYLL